jgi:D-alanyl-D-alanine carboxypeptidase
MIFTNLKQNYFFNSARVTVTGIFAIIFFISFAIGIYDSSAANNLKKHSKHYVVKKPSIPSSLKTSKSRTKLSSKSLKKKSKRFGKVRNFITPEIESKMALDNTGSYILFDPDMQQVLAAKNPDARIPPSSMTKIMTAYIIFDQINKGRLKTKDQCLIGKNVLEKSRIRPGSTLMFLHYGDIVSVDQLIRGLLIVSGNDAAIALAEATAGSIENFVSLMNLKAKELGLTNSNFRNPHGLSEEGHFMSVRDLAILSMRIQKDFPQYSNYFLLPDFTYRKITRNNHNPLIKHGYEGTTGLKTGHTLEGRFGMVGTAIRNNHQLIVVVNHAPTSRQRLAAVKKLLNYGFDQHRKNKISNRDSSQISKMSPNLRPKISPKNSTFLIARN